MKYSSSGRSSIDLFDASELVDKVLGIMVLHSRVCAGVLGEGVRTSAGWVDVDGESHEMLVVMTGPWQELAGLPLWLY